MQSVARVGSSATAELLVIVGHWHVRFSWQVIRLSFEFIPCDWLILYTHNEVVLLHLFQLFRKPCSLYSTESLTLSSTDANHTARRCKSALWKLFGVNDCVKCRNIFPTGSRRNRALFTGKKTKLRLPVKLSLLRRSCSKSDRASPQHLARTIQISSKSVHFRRSYSRTREGRSSAIEYFHGRLFKPIMMCK